MSYERLAARLYNAPLLVTPEKAEVIERVFRAHLDGAVAKLDHYEPKARPDITTQASTTFTRQRGGYLRSDSGIALISIVGSLVQRAHGMDALSGIESYENIGAQLATANADPLVRGILLEFDSPGGEGMGVAGLADSIRATATAKPVIAHANEMAFSAAYWLAASADELYVPATGMVGSVGVIMMHVDVSRANDKRGYEVTHVIAGAQKADFSPHKPLSESALRNAQAMVDRLYGQFVDAVTAGRGIDRQAVIDTQAGLLNPDEAEAIGMVDGTATLEQTIQRLSDVIREPGAKRNRRAAVSAHIPERDPAMSTTVDKPAAAPAQQPAAIYTQADMDKARTDERTKIDAEAQAKASADAKTKADVDAKARIKAITTCDAAKDRPKLAATLALDTDMTPEAAQVVLAAAAKESGGNPLAAAMPPNPRIDASVDADADAPKVVIPVASSIYSSMQDQRLRVINGSNK